MSRRVVKNGQIGVHCAHDGLQRVSELKPHPGNPNQHPDPQIALLAKIIKAQGWRNPIVVSNRSGFITKGHARLAAAKLLGVKEAPVDRQDYATEAEELSDMIADNRIAELAEPDRAMLRELMEQLDTGDFDMDLTGFDNVALAELMTAAPPASEIDADPQIDKAEELREKWGVELGQIWQLGEHRLMCGDCRDRKSVGLLFQDEDRADASVTDPPYNVGINYNNNQSDEQEFENYRKFSRDWFDVAKSVSRVLVFTPGRGKELVNLRMWNEIEKPFDMAIWVKKNSTTHGSLAHFMAWEAILVYGRPTERISQDVYDYPIINQFSEGVALTDYHPTPKRIHFWVNLVSDFVEKGKTCYEPFCGSGTTIIACEQLGRKCRAMEIDPGYVAVSLQRFHDATGKTPKLLNG